jgi:hypothetical protein
MTIEVSLTILEVLLTLINNVNSTGITYNEHVMFISQAASLDAIGQ